MQATRISMTQKPCYIPSPVLTVGVGTSLRMTRIALSPTTHTRLKLLAAKRFRGTGSISKLGCIVLDNYLAHMERAYFGRARVTGCSPVPATMRDYDAVIFDMDGVLCDSEHMSRMVGAAMFELYYNTMVSADDFAPFTGTGEAAFLSGVAQLHGVSPFDADEAKQRFFGLYTSEKYMAELKSFPGVIGLVERIKQLGLKVAVASAADAIKVDANLKAIGLPRDKFDFVTSSDHIANKKPAPDVFLAAAKGIAVDPARCVVVEDAASGVQAALAAGMRCVAVSTSLHSSDLEQAGAHVVREQPAFIEIADLFGRDVFGEMADDGLSDSANAEESS